MSLVCNDPSNVCQLDTKVYTPADGYDCFQVNNQQQFMCTCYGNRFTMNTPCREFLGRQFRIQNSFDLGCSSVQICGTGPNVIACIDKSNSTYLCLCRTENSVDIVENKPCGKMNTRFATVFTRLYGCKSSHSLRFHSKGTEIQTGFPRTRNAASMFFFNNLEYGSSFLGTWSEFPFLGTRN